MKDPKKVKQGRASRNKGKRREREFAQLLQKFGFTAKRTAQRKGCSKTPDVECEELPEIHFEVKGEERLNVYAAFEHAHTEAGQLKIAVLAWKKSRRRWLVILDAEDFLFQIQVKETLMDDAEVQACVDVLEEMTKEEGAGDEI